MLFPDGLNQPDLFITEQLPHRLRNSVAARVNSVAWCLLPAACFAQGESDVGQTEGTVLPVPSVCTTEQIRLYNMPWLFSKQRETGAERVADSR